MKISIPLACLAILFSTTASAQGSDAEREVLAASDARLAAVFRADAETLHRIQDDDFVLAQDGLVLNKDDQIARVLAFESPNQNPTRTVDLRRISFEGNVAIITGVVTISVANGAFSTAFTEVWARKGERWLAKAAHYSTIQLPAE